MPDRLTCSHITVEHYRVVNSVIAWLADYLLIVMAVLALTTWMLRGEPPGQAGVRGRSR